MTKRDYEIIAHSIGASSAIPQNDSWTIQDVLSHLTFHLKKDNERFDAGKFFVRVEHWRKFYGGV